MSMLSQDSPQRRVTQYEKSRDRLLHNAISQSPTKMFQHPETIKPAAYRNHQVDDLFEVSQEHHDRMNQYPHHQDRKLYHADISASRGSFDKKYGEEDLQLSKMASSSSINRQAETLQQHRNNGQPH